MDLNASSLASEHAYLTTVLDFLLMLAKIIIIIALEVPRK